MSDEKEIPYGYVGKILRVNLLNSKITTEEPEETFYRKYVGGWGVAAYYLLKELELGVDPLGSKNKLIFSSGVITGAPIAGCGRNFVGAKSPLTGAFGGGEVGGFWGTELKRAGFDAIVVDGRAKNPVYLWINDEKAEIRDANHLWGLKTKECQEDIHREHGDNRIRVAQIGIGGENLVRFACVINDLHNAAGRSGMGAVMGSKNLKAIAVKGQGRVEVADSEKVREISKELADRFRERPAPISEYGTGRDLTRGAASGNLPHHNFRDGEFPNPLAISAITMWEDGIFTKKEGCFACILPCKKVVEFSKPWVHDPAYGGPEYEALGMLGSNCGVENVKAVCKANELCNAYSLDSISTGSTIAFAMECYEHGLITDKDTDGIKLEWGNADALVKMTEMIAKRKGIGDILAEGTKKAAEKIGKGAEKFAIHVKGQEPAAHDPRARTAIGLGYAVSPTGADHMHNLFDRGFEGRSLDRFRPLGILEPVTAKDFGPKKIRIFSYYINWRTLDNCLLMCMFVPWSFQQKVEIVRAVTGWKSTAWELAKMGERVLNMARVFNVREGFTAQDDWLPERFFQPQTSGPLSKARSGVSRRKLARARKIYYRMQGWNVKTGVPMREKLEELGIGWVAKTLKKN